jgi:hypothetical protein
VGVLPSIQCLVRLLGSAAKNMPREINNCLGPKIVLLN